MHTISSLVMHPKKVSQIMHFQLLLLLVCLFVMLEIGPSRHILSEGSRDVWCRTIHGHGTQVLVNIKGLSEAKIEKMVEAAKKMCPTASWRSGTDVMNAVSTGTYRCEILTAAGIYNVGATVSQCIHAIVCSAASKQASKHWHTILYVCV